MSGNPINLPTPNVTAQEVAATNDADGDKVQHFYLAGGVPPANETGNLTAAQPTAGTPVAGGTVGGSANYEKVGNVTVAVFGAAHAGFTVVLEASPDGGTNWFSMTAQDEMSNTQVRDVPIATNSSRLFSLSLFGLNRFRVRASARTSGTLSVVMAPGIHLIEPVVAAVQSNPAGAQNFSLTPAAAGIGVATTTDALVTLVPQRNQTAAGTATTHTVTAGKTMRFLNLSASFKGVAATSTTCNVYLRAVNTGTVAATSPIVAHAALSVPATANTHASISVPLSGLGALELPSGASFGISAVLTVANAGSLLWPVVTGIEY